MQVDVAATAEAVCPAELAARAVLVVDVLRASTTIVTALANGCVEPAEDQVIVELAERLGLSKARLQQLCSATQS